MQAKIIDRNVIPNRFTFYESDINTTRLIFTVAKINDGVDLTDKTAYLNVERDDLSTDKIALEKTQTDSEIYFSMMVNDSITMKEGIVSAQISFENVQKTEIYKTNVFIFDVINSVNGNASFEKVLPSVIDELENKISNEVSYCENLKNQTDSIRQSVEDLANAFEQTIVKTVNGKMGNVSLTYQDVGAMPASGTLPYMEKTKYPLYIDDVYFDGSNEVHFSIKGNFKQVDDENAVVNLENDCTYYVSNPKEVIISTDDFNSETATLKASVIANFNNVNSCLVSGDIEFAGDDTSGGKFFPKQGVYKFEFIRLRNSSVVYANSLKFKKTSVIYNEPTPFNHTEYVLNEGETYNYQLHGESKITRSISEPLETRLNGLGTLVEDVYDKNYGKRRLDIRCESNNLISMNDFQGNIGSLNVSTDSQTGILTISGVVDKAGTIEIPIGGRAVYNTTVYCRLFNISGHVSTTTLSQLINFETWDTQKIVNKFEILGTNEIKVIDKEKFNMFRPYDKLVMKVNESAIGSTFVNAQYGITGQFTEVRDGFVKHEENAITVHINGPLLKIGDACDKLDMYAGTIERYVHRIICLDKSHFVKDEETQEAVYRGPNGTGLIAENLACDTTKGFINTITTEKDNGLLFEIKEDEIRLIYRTFGSYDNIDKTRFPFAFMYALKKPVIEKISTAPLKYYKGFNKISLDSKIITYESFFRTVKKD